MRFRVSFKTPDAITDVIAEQVEAATEKYRGCDSHDADEIIDGVEHDVRTAMKAVTDKYVSYGENVVIEFDTDTGTAIVVQKGK